MRIHSLVAIICMVLATTFTSCTQKSDQKDAEKNSENKELLLSIGENPAIKNIMTRSSVRQFTKDKISRDTLEILVKAGMAAPTAMNKQPWAFVVVDDRSMLDSLQAVHPYSHLETAAAAIIVCGDVKKAAPETSHDYWIQDCSAASENILLAAHALGLGAVWCGVYPNPEREPGVTRVLGLPEDITPLNIITLGYPEGNVEPKDKWDAEKVHYQKW